MIEVRSYRDSDSEALQRIHRQSGLEYQLPRPEDVDFLQVVEIDGQVVGASMNRVVAETFLLMDQSIDPRDKWTAMRMMQSNTVEVARQRGWRELVAMMPEWMATRFSRRLKMLGWLRNRGWIVWSKLLL